jgi:hypothetical protein
MVHTHILLTLLLASLAVYAYHANYLCGEIYWPMATNLCPDGDALTAWWEDGLALDGSSQRYIRVEQTNKTARAAIGKFICSK